MQPDISPVDQLYLKAEELSQNFSLFPRKEPASFVKGLLTESQIDNLMLEVGYKPPCFDHLRDIFRRL